MWGDDVEEREQGCPSDPLLADIWRDEQAGREWHPDPAIRDALDATRHLPESGPPPPPPPAPVVRPEAVGGGDPYGEMQQMKADVQAAHEAAMWRAHGYKGEHWSPGKVAGR